MLFEDWFLQSMLHFMHQKIIDEACLRAKLISIPFATDFAEKADGRKSCCHQYAYWEAFIKIFFFSIATKNYYVVTMYLKYRNQCNVILASPHRIFNPHLLKHKDLRIDIGKTSNQHKLSDRRLVNCDPMVFVMCVNLLIFLLCLFVFNWLHAYTNTPSG